MLTFCIIVGVTIQFIMGVRKAAKERRDNEARDKATDWLMNPEHPYQIAYRKTHNIYGESR